MAGIPDRDALASIVASRGEVVTKESLLTALCRGKRVLDIGCIDHSVDVAMRLGDRWMHRQICAVALEVVGVDILDEAVAAMRALGFEMVVADAQAFDLRRTFDVIVAGDIIEHVPNPGLLLASALRHCHDDSVVVVTTPNAFSFMRFAKAGLRNRVSVNSDHVAWFDPLTLARLAEKSGFSVDAFQWIDTRYGQLSRRRLLGRLGSVLDRFVTQARPVLRADFAMVLRPAS